MGRSLHKELTDHVTALRRYAYVLTSNTHEAEDLVQDCLTSALTKTDLLIRVGNMRSYLFTMLHNLFIDKMRAKKRAGNVVPLEAVPAANLSVAARQESLIDLKDVERAMRTLPEDLRSRLRAPRTRARPTRPRSAVSSSGNCSFRRPRPDCEARRRNSLMPGSPWVAHASSPRSTGSSARSR